MLNEASDNVVSVAGVTGIRLPKEDNGFQVFDLSDHLVCLDKVSYL